MKPKKCLIVATAAAVLGFASSSLAQDAGEIIEEFKAGTLPIKETSTPILLSFAMEWDAQAADTNNAGNPLLPDQYQALTIPDESRLKASVDALTNNSDAMDFYTNPETIEAFNRAYQNAADQGSPTGMIPHEEAMRYWMLSRTITAGPDAIEAYRAGSASPAWCLPPLIRCTPPQPAPKE